MAEAFEKDPAQAQLELQERVFWGKKGHIV